jgi:hypothetical protein
MFKMKKSLVAALTGALVVGATATTFAAANPFSDVPAGHWAYRAVTRLANEGIVEGYGDGTFAGGRNITRYEMAQIIARAMDKAPKANISYASRSDLDKLAAEFRDELDNLGVRVDELERNADKVKWNGKIEYTYNHHKYDGGQKSSGHNGVFRLEPVAEVNDHWKAVARFDANYDGKSDSTGYTESDGSKAGVKLKRVYAQGDYDKFGVKIGRFGFCPSIEDGIAVDTVVSGAELSFGSKWQAILTAGRIGRQSDEAHFYKNNLIGDSTNILGLNVRYNPGESGLYGGASYYHAKDDDFRYLKKSLDGDKASIWAVGLGYKFNDMLDLHGSFGRNGKSDYQKSAWAVDLRYGNYDSYSEKGSWAVWAGYAKFGQGVGIATDQGDDIATGQKGWHLGAAYAPFKNVGVLVRYANAKFIEDGSKDRHFWARTEFSF